MGEALCPTREFGIVKIGSYTYEEYVRMVEDFHGAAAPGVLIGGFMVDVACRDLSGKIFDALCETSACLPDAVQLLTPCTVGNGWLKIIDLGRFALALYDKQTGSGTRVFIDPARLGPWPLIREWYFKEKGKEESDVQALRDQIEKAGPAICGVQAITVPEEFLQKRRRGPVGTCPSCKEGYHLRDGKICKACAGRSLYASTEKPAG